MNCRKFERLLDIYLSHDTSSETVLEMQHHASICSRCRSLQLQWEQISRTARQLPRSDAPEGFEHQLMRRIRAQEYRKFRYYWFNLPRPLIQAAACSLIVLAVGLSIMLMPGKQPPGIPAVVNRTSDPEAIQRLAVPPPTLVRSASRNPAEELEGGIRIGRPLTQPPLPILSGEFSVPADMEYVDYLLKGTGNREVFVRVPRVIRYQAPANNDTFYVRNISH